ncbi:MAG: type II toxin-antitoxin system PemK/MazF family toxin [Deltaproteobacteria bacterium]|nr:type II toxin-antitoxin system PemK/MazF family toxin [Deltaproteobacteria bacterium]
MSSSGPSRADIWFVDLNPTRGHEQAGHRPALVVSVDPFNEGPSGLVVLLPITSKAKRVPFHVPLVPPEGGLSQPSFIKCEDIRSVAKERLTRRTGGVTPVTMEAVEDRLRILLGL